MPWMETAPVEQRRQFIEDFHEGLYTMTELCARYGISRKTGYKWLERFSEGGRRALADRSRAPHSSPQRISEEVAEMICEARRKHPDWGAAKLLDWLSPRHPDVRWLRRPGDLVALAATQARLLDALWPLLAPGGRLLYCTCSVFRSEGSAQIDAFLQRRGDAALAASPPSPGQLLPLVDNDNPAPSSGSSRAADGFFLALLEKPRSAP